MTVKRVPTWVFNGLALIALAAGFVGTWIALNPVQFLLLATPFALPAIIVGGVKLVAWRDKRATPEPAEPRASVLGLTSIPADVEEMLEDLAVSLRYAHTNAQGLTQEGCRLESLRVDAIIERLQYPARFATPEPAEPREEGR